VPSHEAWARASPDEQLRIERQWLELITGRATGESTSEVFAFEQLYRAYASRLHALGTSWLGVTDAFDVVQTVFLSVWRRRRELPADTVLRAYLLGAMHHRIRNARRNTAAHLRLVTTERGESPVAEPHDALEYEDALRAMLEGLPPRTRLTVLLYYALGFTRRQVAAILGISVRTVKHDLTAARPALKKLLGMVRSDGVACLLA